MKSNATKSKTVTALLMIAFIVGRKLTSLITLAGPKFPNNNTATNEGTTMLNPAISGTHKRSFSTFIFQLLYICDQIIHIGRIGTIVKPAPKPALLIDQTQCIVVYKFDRLVLVFCRAKEELL